VSQTLAVHPPRSGPRATAGTVAGPPPFQRFLDTHREVVWRFLVSCVGREDADECFEETFVSALRAYPRLRVDGPQHNLRAWVLTIAHRKALDAHRGRARRALPVAEIAEVVDGDGAGGQAESGMRTRLRANAGVDESQERDETLWQAVRELPARQRSAVVLRYVADLPHRDIATAIGCSEEAARRSLHEGLTRLRKEMAI